MYFNDVFYLLKCLVYIEIDKQLNITDMKIVIFKGNLVMS